MGLKQNILTFIWVVSFENDVNMYGTQTGFTVCYESALFENDVNMYGTQTKRFWKIFVSWFENDVNMYGTQTNILKQMKVF